jgi:hypothetical protein
VVVAPLAPHLVKKKKNKENILYCRRKKKLLLTIINDVDHMKKPGSFYDTLSD